MHVQSALAVDAATEFELTCAEALGFTWSSTVYHTYMASCTYMEKYILHPTLHMHGLMYSANSCSLPSPMFSVDLCRSVGGDG